MAETLTKGVWRWTDMVDDLRKAGLAGAIIDPLSLSKEGHTIGGETKEGVKFVTTWVKDQFFLVSMTKKTQTIIDAFTRILEYKPFAEYISNESGLYTVEWDKKDPKGRFKELQQKREKNLKRI